MKMPKSYLLLLTVAMLGILGCTHTPDKSTLQRMTPSKARSVIKSAVVSGKVDVEIKLENQYALYPIATVLMNTRQITFITGKSVPDGARRVAGAGGIAYTFKFREITKVVSTLSIDVKITQEGNRQFDLVVPEKLADEFADAIYVLKEIAPEEIKKDDSNFERAVQTYRNATTKPEFTEEARKFKVSAENAVREKRFADAVGYYESALDIAPWWPDGHFNSALVLGEIGDYETAAFEMKRYLKLEPIAPNARAAQDKVYEWESKIK